MCQNLSITSCAEHCTSTVACTCIVLLGLVLFAIAAAILKLKVNRAIVVFLRSAWRAAYRRVAFANNEL
jgi:hypothetical protein